jgi:hypothetical protein
MFNVGGVTHCDLIDFRINGELFRSYSLNYIVVRSKNKKLQKSESLFERRENWWQKQDWIFFPSLKAAKLSIAIGLNQV